MWSNKYRQARVVSWTLSAILLLSFTPLANAQQATSPKYQVNEVFFGTGGIDTCDGVNPAENDYCALMTAGELTIGNTKSDQYQAYGGFNTTRQPSLEVAVLKSDVDMGLIKPDTTGVGTAEFQVKAYLASGYTIQIAGTPPMNGTRSVAAMGTRGVSQKGVEQFGMNLTQNTFIAGSANPSQDPDNTFAFGFANNDTATGMVYNVADEFRYVNGDIIARSESSTSYTKYTISYIMNVSSVTPGGSYKTSHTVVATAKY